MAKTQTKIEWLQEPFAGIQRHKIPMGSTWLVAKALGIDSKAFYGSLIRLAAYCSETKKPLTRITVANICNVKLTRIQRPRRMSAAANRKYRRQRRATLLRLDRKYGALQKK